jgi:adenosylcobinamide-GDP ribazoletransferase
MTAPVADPDRDNPIDPRFGSPAASNRGDHAGEPSPPVDLARRSWPALRGIRASFAFFTRLPAGGFPYSSDELAWAPAHAPLVGALLGAALGCLHFFLLPLGALASATLVLGVSMLLTGALHEDGLADTSDALGGGHDPAKVFAILKDSRVGAFGAAAIAISVLARAALLAKLEDATLWAFPLAWSAARVGPVWLMVALPYVTPSQSKSERIVRADHRQALIASAWFGAAALIAIDAGIAPLRTGAIAAAVIVATVVSGYRFYRRVGGITGDFLGATEQLGELAALAACTWPL